MILEVKCKSDLGIKGCDYAASGETPADVLEYLLPHLADTHNLPMPKADEIMNGKSQSLLESNPDPGVDTVVRRLRQTLDIPAPDSLTEHRPTVGRLPNR